MDQSEIYSWARTITLPFIAVFLAWAIFRIDWWIRHRSEVPKTDIPVESDSKDPTL